MAALPKYESKITDDTTDIDISSLSGLEFVADGEVQVILRKWDNGTGAAVEYPRSGDGYYTLIANTPRAFSSADFYTMDIELIDATYCVVTGE